MPDMMRLSSARILGADKDTNILSVRLGAMDITKEVIVGELDGLQTCVLDAATREWSLRNVLQIMFSRD